MAGKKEDVSLEQRVAKLEEMLRQMIARQPHMFGAEEKEKSPEEEESSGEV